MTLTLRNKITILLMAFVMGFALLLVPSPAQATHTYAESCALYVSPAPTVVQNATKDGSFVVAGANLTCHEGELYTGNHQITEMYINATLQIRSAVTLLWYNRDTASARWTGLIGNTPPLVRANLADACENTLSRSHRIRFNDAWYRTGDGVIHQMTQGSYGAAAYINCGN